MKKHRRRHSLLRVLLLDIPVLFIVCSVLLVTLMKWTPVLITPLMIKREISHSEEKKPDFQHNWVRLEKIAPAMKKAVIASEDNRFFTHKGFDFEEIKKMRHDMKTKGTKLRGCSTISQQTAKNCFTWCTHTWIRKAFEAYFTVLIEKIWGKERILEVYLNVVEMGPGIYGTESAARHYFDKHASELQMADATSLACCLPNPLKRTPDWARKHMASRRNAIARITTQLEYPDWIE